MFKLVLDAGHGYNTAGKRCLKSIDTNQTREWWLNDRICDKIEQKLKSYNGVEVKRVDDVSGKTDVALSKRTTTANNYGADFYLSIHHNAGINGGKGGGIVAYTYTKVGNATKEWQKSLYNETVKLTGLKGNRANPLASADFYVLHHTKASAVLLECGFMDSTVDTPIILTDDFADKLATACVNVIVSKAKLTKKEPEKIYRVQVDLNDRNTAENLKNELVSKGYSAVIV